MNQRADQRGQVVQHERKLPRCLKAGEGCTIEGDLYCRAGRGSGVKWIGVGVRMKLVASRS